MTETAPETELEPTAEVADVALEPEAQPAAEAEPVDATCRHCGAHTEFGPEGEPDDWLCEHCERYQDSMVCPTCHQPARISLMPAELAPEVHAPSRRRKGKE